MSKHREATLVTHRNCGAFVLEGLDHDVAAFVVRVDPTPLSWAGEIKAQQRGRRTFALIGKELHHRNDFHAHAQSEFPVFTNHICHYTPPPEWCAPAPKPRQPPPKSEEW